MRTRSKAITLLAALLAAGLVAAAADTAEARGGCGPGFHRGAYGACRPNGYRPYGYRRLGFHGPRRFHPFARRRW